jgi:hypothetical protein
LALDQEPIVATALRRRILGALAKHLPNWYYVACYRMQLKQQVVIK